MKQSFVNGSTLIGTAIAVYSFSVLLETSGLMYWGYIAATFFMLGAALEEFFMGIKQKR